MKLELAVCGVAFACAGVRSVFGVGLMQILPFPPLIRSIDQASYGLQPIRSHVERAGSC